MSGRSTTGDVIKTGKLMMSQANSSTRRGPGNKNLGPSRVNRPNPKSMIRGVAGRTIKGPDLGGGGG